MWKAEDQPLLRRPCIPPPIHSSTHPVREGRTLPRGPSHQPFERVVCAAYRVEPTVLRHRGQNGIAETRDIADQHPAVVARVTALAASFLAGLPKPKARR